ncbi:hypothetical protein D806_054840 [Mycolicibacterium smegmatis MKD8]|uniref:Uncharacterized protein n=2 Tax=Mycolicibacterium TaxID=1866885 RepID=A0A2U9PX95_MYCSE|nr:hypothetical protein D806_054840 [Mycolicibacterium smegmatis MKD8]
MRATGTRHRSEWRPSCGAVAGGIRHAQAALISRHRARKLSGSRHVPAVDGKIIDCSPRYGRLCRAARTAESNVGRGTVRVPIGCLPETAKPLRTPVRLPAVIRPITPRAVDGVAVCLVAAQCLGGSLRLIFGCRGGTEMSDHLSVDGDGLAAAAVGSVDIAEALAAAGAVNSPAAGVQPSQAGVGAVNAALASIRAHATRQAGRQGSDLHIGNALYVHADDAAADRVTRTI